MDVKEAGKAIGHLRKKAGFTQQKLAALLNVSDKAVSKWERGLSCPDISLLPKISILLDTDIESLLYGHYFQHKNRWCGILLLDPDSQISPAAILYDKPFVCFLLSSFMLTGITDILVINDDGSTEELIGNGEEYGIHVQYGAPMDDFAGNRNVAVFQGNEALYGMDLTKYCQRAMTNHAGASVLALQGGAGLERKEVFFDHGRKILSADPVRIPRDHYYRGPFLFCHSEQWRLLDDKVPSYDLLNDELEKKGCLFAEPVGRGMHRFRLQTLDDALEFASFVRMTQIQRGEQISCLEEIAWRRGLVSKEEFCALSEKQKNPEIKQYLIRIRKEDT